MDRPPPDKRQSQGFGPLPACIIAAVNTGFFFVVGSGLGFSSGPVRKGGEILDIPDSMLVAVILAGVPASIALWIGFRNGGKTVVGTVIAVAYCLLMMTFMREAVKFQ